jgi:hypothetical protein
LHPDRVQSAVPVLFVARCSFKSRRPTAPFGAGIESY